MHITFYKSALCPRCRAAGKNLRELLQNGNHELEIIDIVTNPRKSWQAGVRMIPAVVAGEKMLSGFMLSRNALKEFLRDLDQENSDRQ